MATTITDARQRSAWRVRDPWLKKTTRRRILKPGVILGFLLLLVMDLPILWMILTSFHSENSLFSGSITGLFRRFSIGGYGVLPSFIRYVLNSLIICGAGTLAVVLVACVSGYSLARTEFRGRNALLAVLASALVIPYVVLSVPVYVGYLKLHLLNSYFGLILGYVGVSTPVTTLLMVTYYRNFPRELEEAAVVDGARIGTIIGRVVVPNSLPGVTVCATYAFVTMWQDFLLAAVVMSSPSKYTLPVGLAGLFGQYTTAWNSVMAVSAVSVVPSLILFLVMQRRLTSGLMSGAVRG